MTNGKCHFYLKNGNLPPSRKKNKYTPSNTPRAKLSPKVTCVSQALTQNGHSEVTEGLRGGTASIKIKIYGVKSTNERSFDI